MSTTIEIMGGLGNQLFQIFTLISYSIKTKKPFYFENKPITCGERKKYYWDTPLLNKLKGFIKPPLQNQQQLIYREPFFHYAPIPHTKDNTANIKLHGYFQSYKYFEEDKELIFKMINLKESQSQIKEKVKTISSYENVVSLHFRVGDYAHQPQNHPLMPIEYYEKALEQLIDDTNGKQDWIILYFCEENDLVYVNEKIHSLKKNMKFKKLTFMKVPGQLDDWEQILLMSLCQHHIIANSTFSWWGAYFSRGGGIVYYPNKWFGPALGEKKMEDLFLEEGWKKVIIV
jgi:hypothetical protein